MQFILQFTQQSTRFKHVFFLGIILSLSACGGGVTEKTTQSSTDSLQQANANAKKIAETFENFDRSYVGKWQKEEIQMNLRRYGNELWGVFWVKGKDIFQTLQGTVKPDGKSFSIHAFNLINEETGVFNGMLDDPKILKGFWIDANAVEREDYELVLWDENFALQIQLDEIKVNKNSGDAARTVHISYPQLIGIQDKNISDRINTIIEKYFLLYTKVDSVDKVNFKFKEDVKFDVTLMGKDVISICKNHHISRNDNTQLFDDSHGININFKKGRVYQIRDLFKLNTLDLLNAELLKRINKACSNTLTPEELEKCKLKPDEEHSYSLSKDKITFHLTERLPYKSRGCGYVRIEYKDLKDFINPSGPLDDFIK